MPDTVLITGASRGIGRAAARLFARHGFQVVAGYHSSPEAAQTLVAEIERDGGRALAVCADVGDPRAVEEMFAAAEKSFGGIDILVNNAGIAQQKLFTDITDADWAAMLSTNLSGAFYCCRRALPYMIRQKQGCIVNLSSIWGITGASCEVHYSAVKAGIIGMTKALAKEVGPSGIRVNCVAPGVVDTDMNAALDDETLAELSAETPLGTIGMPENIAEAVYYLASDHAGFITGQVLSPNGGFLI